MSVINPNITPKIVVDGYTSNEPFVKFTQLYEWTSSNYCLSVNNGYTYLNNIIINGDDKNFNIYQSNVNSNLIFGINGNNNPSFIFKNGNSTELMRINNNVGIGTTNPNYKLDVNGSINSILIYKNNIELDNIYLQIKNNYWLSNNNNKIYIDLASNISGVGIGNSQPLGTLHLGSRTTNSDGSIIITKYNNNNIVRNFKFGYDDNFNFVMGDFGDALTQDWKYQFYIHSNAPSNALFISSSGNVSIGTSENTNKLNVNGNVRATSFIGIGSNITTIDYNNITVNRPELTNLNNWIYVPPTAETGAYLYNRTVASISLGKTTANFRHRLDIEGSLNVSENININNINISNIYINRTEVAENYLSLQQATSSNAWIKKNIENNQVVNIVQLNTELEQNYKVNIGRVNVDEISNKLNVYGELNANKITTNDGANIRNIQWVNIRNYPSFLLESRAAELYATIDYLNNTYNNNLLVNIATNYATVASVTKLSTDFKDIYRVISPQLIDSVAEQLGANNISVFYSNLRSIPYNYDKTKLTIETTTFGFGTNFTSDRITVDGTTVSTFFRATSNIFENNVLLRNTYITSNVLSNILPSYDTIFDRKIASYTTSNIYPPSTLIVDTLYYGTINNASIGNGTYSFITSSKPLNNNELSSNIFVSNTTPWISPAFYTGSGSLYNGGNKTSIINTGGLSIDITGEWVQIYYSESFIISELEIIGEINTISLPSRITLVATNDNVNQHIGVNKFELVAYTWTRLIDNYSIQESNYITLANNINKSFKISINNVNSFKYYRLIVHQVYGSTSAKIIQIKLKGYENKKEWNHSGNNIYSYSNIAINTIDNASAYSLNVNGHIYSSSNLYANSNIGIGTTSPIEKLHISDGSVVISKVNSTTDNRFFKFGYDNNYNFVLGDNGTSANISFKPQFYINANAPQHSLIIDNNGNVGINTTLTSSYKFNINGSTFQNGDSNATSNIFSGSIYSSNSISAQSNLNIGMNIITSNLYTSNNIINAGTTLLIGTVGIGTTTTDNLNGTLNINSISNSYGIRNTANLNENQTINSFIGKNNSNGFINTYYFNSDINSNNYLAWYSAGNAATSILTLTSNNKVGIGTTNPDGLFQIGNGGKLRIGTTDNDYSIFGLINTDNDNNNTKIHLKGINKSINFYATGGYYFNIGSSEKIQINNAGNIGIGTTNFDNSYKLVINGSMYASNLINVSNAVNIGSLNAESDGSLTIAKRDISNNSNIAKIGYDSDFNFIIGDNTTTWKKQFYINKNASDNSLLINSLSFVGIGNTNPIGTLHIGNTYMQNEGNLIISKRLGTNIARNFKFGYDDNFNFILGDFGDRTTQTWKPQFLISKDAPQNALTIDNNGNVGIGTTSSTEKFAVNGNTTIIGSFTQSSPSGVATSNIFRGVVGIGTTNSESHNLNVNGTVKFNNYLYSKNISNIGSIVQNGNLKIGPGVNETSGDENNFNVYINTSIGIEGSPFTIKNSTIRHNGGDLILNSTTLTASCPTTINNDVIISSKVGIGTTTANNILQIGNGGKLRISNDASDYSVIGTNDIINTSSNTRILIKGSTYGTGNEQGNIEFYGTATGKFIFYGGGLNTNELMRISSNGNVGIGTTNNGANKLDVNGSSIIRGNLESTGIIKENSSNLSDIYVKLNNLSNLSVNNYNLKKKYGYNSTITTTPFLFNTTTYYKYDIDLRLITNTLQKELNAIRMNYRIFNIKCYSSDGIFENPRGNINGNLNVLNYDIFMSDIPLRPVGLRSDFVANEIIPYSSNIVATGTPENLSLNNILPGLISLIRTSDFNYLSIVSRYSNLNVSYIVEDYLG
jgi:hypothetical protein